MQLYGLEANEQEKQGLRFLLNYKPFNSRLTDFAPRIKLSILHCQQHYGLFRKAEN